MSTTWIVTTTGSVSDLIALGRNRGDSVTAVVLGDAQVSGVDSLIRIPVAAGQPVEILAPAVAQVVEASGTDLVVAPEGSAERALVGAVAAKFDAPVLFGAREIGMGTARLARFGAITLEDVTFSGVAVAIMAGGSDSADSSVSPESPVTETATTATTAQITSENISATPSVDIARAPRVVAAGRGFEAKEDLALAQDLATALGAELGVSRPLAEGYGWMPRESYIGISGQIVAPELYVAVGISGQIHHTAGVTDSQTIVAINNDELATMFDFADYGIVGDLYDVLPELTAALSD
ncbi:electron transfer flavoprotein subunit alpha/FixB family protein [Arcanobacterium haemolyticum]|uniref:Electron transfer flavoprotein alpha subunit n=1 Tax=Arcanobacterium haemolyticum (strain ATCC 9345 / DSM 20595 / CCM 5947 / CCUG 17215 / LMG 16163 / NBRC 15585 / NCTC 8452 / 11018) TaxID=644284 RepID=D7BN26_ARCHD|nr:electron transfer flavoprotein subunit alpha/FixB family protein [Arcanobacterium haemolyticum]ADH92325.1 Electron transfer flavoprotein alpha subunit [Arcanobacterium haemolyticum DSM 20595]SQH28954.1 Electron transfer flavoprotein large subunit [Arcanobacterium haemolyticum]